MLITKTISEIRSSLQTDRNSGKRVVFVPTMGALHDGHLALVKKAREISDVVVVSIFVNRLQFNDLSDYQKYPKQIEDDLKKLEIAGASHVFLPGDAEIFPDDFSLKIIPTKLTDCLCGSFRPGHFEGVVMVVAKLFNIVRPQVAIFGEKDFQQVAVIRKLVKDLNLEIEIMGYEIVREPSGLAMSSRNQRLSNDGKIKAAMLFRALFEVRETILNNPNQYKNILQEKSRELVKLGFEKVDYLEMRNEFDLSEPEMPNNVALSKNDCKNQHWRIFAAAYLEGVRLIDNLVVS